MGIHENERTTRQGSIQVLLVAGRGLMRDGLHLLLHNSTHDYVVNLAAPESEEAMSRVSERMPDVILMVASIASRTGLDLTRRLRLRCPQAKLIILGETLVSGAVREALRLGAAGYVIVSESFSALEVAIHRVVRNQTAFPPEVDARLVATSRGLRITGDAHVGSLDTLTPRELEVLTHLAQGRSVKECARLLQRSMSTIDNHKSRIMKKLGVHRAVDLTRLAIREGLVPG